MVTLYKLQWDPFQWNVLVQPDKINFHGYHFHCYTGPVSIQCFRCKEGDGGGGQAAVRVGERLAREACSGFPLVKYKLMYMTL